MISAPVPGRSFSFVLGVLGVFVATAGCIPALQNRFPVDGIPPAQLVAMPPQVLVYTLDFSDHRSFDEQPSSAVATDAEGTLREIIDAQGAHFAPHDVLVTCGVACARFYRWGGMATLEIGLQREQIRNYGFHSVTNWTFRGDLSAVRQSLSADFALFVMLKQTRQTTGRKVVMALGGSYIIGAQIDAACVADLHDGAMIWCTSFKDDSRDLGDPGQVPKVMQTLLRSLFGRPAPATALNANAG
jgi:hypothetical protein